VSGRGRCWLCGALLEAEEARVCEPCLESAEGLCGRCGARLTCSGLYRAALDDRKERGLSTPPMYPPCCRTLDSAVVPPPWLLRIQLRQYGGAYCGPAALLLAAGDASARAVEAHEVLGQELAEAWGAKWRRAA